MRGLQERIPLIKYDGILFNDLFASKSPKVAVEWAIWKLCILVQTGDLYCKTVQCTDQCFTGINRSWCVSGQCLEQLRKIPKILCQDINLLSVNILTLTCDIVLHMQRQLMAVPLLRMFLRASVTACHSWIAFMPQTQFDQMESAEIYPHYNPRSSIFLYLPRL